MKTISYKNRFQKDNGIFIGDTVNLNKSHDGYNTGLVMDVEGEQYVIRIASGKLICKDANEVAIF